MCQSDQSDLIIIMIRYLGSGHVIYFQIVTISACAVTVNPPPVRMECPTLYLSTQECVAAARAA